MSKELLKALTDVLDDLKLRRNLSEDDALNISDSVLMRAEKAIENYLAQPEQELLTSRAIIQACPEHYCDIEKDAFRVGIKWYEKYVARIGVYSNE